MPITSRQNPVVARFRDVVRGNAGDVMLLDGAHLIGEAVAAGIAIELAVVASGAAEEKDDVRRVVAALARSSVEVTTVSAAVMAAISPLRSPSAIAAVAARPIFRIEQLYQSTRPLVVIAVDVQDPGNLGAIVRVAEAAGASGVIASGASASPFGWKALRGSMGSALRLPIVCAGSAEETIVDARRRRCRIVATVPRGGTPLFEVDLTGPVAVLIGGEGPGLSAEIIDGAELRTTIPMEPPVESLNAAVTAALTLYEARRQRLAGSDRSRN